MNHRYIIICLLFFLKIGYPQQFPIDFSNSTLHTFSTTGGATFSIEESPNESNNPTGQFFRSSATSGQQHILELTEAINLIEEDKITMRFYAFDPNNHEIILRLENGTEADVQVSNSLSSQNIWTDLIFDFETVNGTGSYNRLVIMIDDGSSIPGAFRIDDINNGSTATDPNELDVIYTDLVWSDEFDSSTRDDVNSEKWHHQTFGPNNGMWFNMEEQHYTDRQENSYIENGFLTIVAKSEDNYEQNGVELDYTSARLNSKFAFQYGRVDVRAKLPAGNGTWPAIWMLGKNVNEIGAYWQLQGFGTTGWPECGEIDIMEHGLGAVNYTSSAIHTPSSFGNTVNTESQEIEDVANTFHIYSVNWSPNQITFLVDGIAFYTYNPAIKNADTWPFDLPQYLILNVAMGGFSGTIDNDFVQGEMVIDYVRIYQNDNLSVGENEVNQVSVYPNPATDIINIKSINAIDHLELYNVLGKQVLRRKNADKIVVSNFETGIYILKIYSGKNIVTKKIIVN